MQRTIGDENAAIGLEMTGVIYRGESIPGRNGNGVELDRDAVVVHADE